MKKKILIAILTVLMVISFTFVIIGCANNQSQSEWGTTFTVETAYAKAQELGYEGTLQEFMDSIKGKDGVDGQDGKDGKDGKDGLGIKSVTIVDGNLVLVFSDDTSVNCGKVVGNDGKDGQDGKDGEDGKDGVGIKSISIVDGELIVTLTDDSTINCGKIREDEEKSTYEIYKDKYGYEGTKEEWVDELVNGTLTNHVSYEITFDSNGGNYTPDSQTVRHGKKIEKPTDPTKEGYTFNGWTCDGTNVWNFDEDVVSCTIILTASWVTIESEYVPDDADPDKVISVRVLKSGYGEDWLRKLKFRFEATYPGYYVSLKEPNLDMRGDTVLSRISRGYAREKTDLFVTGDITDSMINSANNYYPGTPLAADLTDLVFNQKAIGFNGQEETKTVLQKLNPSMAQWVQDKTDNAIYGMPYINRVGGLTVNKTNLLKFGYTELPRTTDELVAMATSIYTGKKADGTYYSEGPATKSYLFPFTYSSETLYGTFYYYTALAQKDLDFYNTLMNFTDKNGVRLIENGYNLYQDAKMVKPMEMMYFSYDPKLAAYGSTTSTLDVAQGKMVATSGDRAVFMWNGDWMFNEVSANFTNAKDDLDFINYPVDSSIADEVFGDLSHLDADKLLSYVIKLVDENKTIEQIVSAVKANKNYDITTAQAERIANARGIYYSLDSLKCFVPADTPKKEIVAKFLRMMASEDASQIIAEKANASSAFATTENTYSTVDFVKNASKISVNRYANAIAWNPQGLRKEMKKTSIMYTQGEFLTMLWQEGTPSMYNNGKVATGATWDGIYGANARARLSAVCNLFKDNWAQALADNNITA